MKFKGILLILLVVGVVAMMAIPAMPDVFDDRPKLKLVTFLPDGPVAVGSRYTEKFLIQNSTMSGAQTLVDGPRVNVQVYDSAGVLHDNRTLSSNWYADHSDSMVFHSSGVWTFKFIPVTEVAGYKNPDPVIKQVTVLA